MRAWLFQHLTVSVFFVLFICETYRAYDKKKDMATWDASSSFSSQVTVFSMYSLWADQALRCILKS